MKNEQKLSDSLGYTPSKLEEAAFNHCISVIARLYNKYDNMPENSKKN